MHVGNPTCRHKALDVRGATAMLLGHRFGSAPLLDEDEDVRSSEADGQSSDGRHFDAAANLFVKNRYF